MTVKSDNSIKSIHVHYNQFNYALNKLESCYEGIVNGDDSRGVAILGRSGTGKTHLLNYFHSKYPSSRGNDGTKMPIVYIKTPSSPTVKGLVEALLHAIGDPLFNKGTLTEKSTRLVNLLKRADAKVVILDEFQHFVDKGGRKVQYAVADELKVIVENSGVGLIVSGLPYCQSVIMSNEQFTRRFSSPVTLPQFDWSVSDDRANFKGILKAMQSSLESISMPDLTSDEMAFRFYCASGGLIGRVANIFIQLVKDMANKHGTKDATLDDLNAAAKEACFDMPLGIDNPFSRQFDVKPTKEVTHRVMEIGDERGVVGLER
ncbi:TniB family NTP-binding protein [Thiohalophilus sp.]|uniref:TniB family NTP-binding protein n=1 Tax=Thiohalophilus sp. TaxID=3028392 RepID=UPI002ACE8ED2|nr:TniB family NTP-binding protein [Thiohalophilus sp.]MDZ7660925.1 TniB family NTP-binding protein [Thiohalophilus sp.]